MAELKWVLEDNGIVLRADVPDMGVTLTVEPVNQPERQIYRAAKVFVRAIALWPPIEKGHFMSAWYETVTLDDAKKNSLLAFMSWARSVITIATSDGHGNITIDLGDDNEW